MDLIGESSIERPVGVDDSVHPPASPAVGHSVPFAAEPFLLELKLELKSSARGPLHATLRPGQTAFRQRTRLTDGLLTSLGDAPESIAEGELRSGHHSALIWSRHNPPNEIRWLTGDDDDLEICFEPIINQLIG
ncbi:hypothetical protein H4Q26_010777 [Puccinia striiformis f. sp. tritici PST-130]|nr:hypothetical protein H4Q26_010777 [Puccinia striiformis f. sp. tritici PST-130]